MQLAKNCSHFGCKHNLCWTNTQNTYCTHVIQNQFIESHQIAASSPNAMFHNNFSQNWPHFLKENLINSSFLYLTKQFHKENCRQKLKSAGRRNMNNNVKANSNQLSRRKRPNGLLTWNASGFFQLMPFPYPNQLRCSRVCLFAKQANFIGFN